MLRIMARIIIGLLLVFSAAALWAQSSAVTLTGETHVSIALILAIMGLVATVGGMWITSARATREFQREWREAFVQLQQSMVDHQKAPHLTHENIAAIAQFQAGKWITEELCNMRHEYADERLQAIHAEVKDIKTDVHEIRALLIEPLGQIAVALSRIQQD